MRKYWKLGKVEITICGRVILAKIYNITFRKIGYMWDLTNINP